MKRILIATDGSAGSRAAVAEGVELARRLEAAVIVVAVRHAPLPVLGDPYYQRVLSEELEGARAAAAEAVALAAEEGVEAVAEVLEGEPAREILNLARLRDADLIVVGSRGRGALAGALLGSVSRAVVHGADRAVLVVKGEPGRAQGRAAA